MLNQILMASGILCSLVGLGTLAVLLSKPPSRSDDGAVIVGGVLLSLGAALVAMSVRTWLNWRKYQKTSIVDTAEPGNDPEWPDLTPQPLLKPATHHAAEERRRSQRIMVQVAVLLRAETPNQEHTPLLAFTVAVNAHGGLLETPFRIRVGQKITLVLPQSSREAGCRVLHSQKFSQDSFATAFEFDQQISEFWPIASPPRDWSLASVL